MNHPNLTYKVTIPSYRYKLSTLQGVDVKLGQRMYPQSMSEYR